MSFKQNNRFIQYSIILHKTKTLKLKFHWVNFKRVLMKKIFIKEQCQHESAIHAHDNGEMTLTKWAV